MDRHDRKDRPFRRPDGTWDYSRVQSTTIRQDHNRGGRRDRPSRHPHGHGAARAQPHGQGEPTPPPQGQGSPTPHQGVQDMDGHPMNPFDFVPIIGQMPNLRSPCDWLDESKFGKRLSGRITVTLTCLTPLHVTGEVTTRQECYSFRTNNGQVGRTPAYEVINTRKFYCANGSPTLPATAIKAVLRSYMEALTNGIVTAHLDNTEYRKEKGKRHRGFWVGSDYGTGDKNGRFQILDGPKEGQWRPYHEFSNVLPEAFSPGLSAETLDVTSFLFGAPGAAAGQGVSQEKEPPLSWRGRISITDAVFRDDQLGDFEAVDVLKHGEPVAFGKPNPSASTWWYFTPHHVEKRVSSRGHETVEFLPGKLRGRKFYFHQNPRNAVEHYMTKWDHTKPDETTDAQGRPLGRNQPRLVKYKVKGVKPGETSQEFTIDFHDVPETLLKLFLVVLCPSGRVRHKAGGLKPLGFGSIEFNVTKIEIEARGLARLSRKSGNENERIEESLMQWVKAEPKCDQPADWREQEFVRLGLVNQTCWEWLRFILSCPENVMEDEDRVFAYPRYYQPAPSTKPPTSPSERGFAFPVPWPENQDGEALRAIAANPRKVIDFCRRRPRMARVPIEFDTYQGESEGFQAQRKLAVLPENWRHIHPDSPLKDN